MHHEGISANVVATRATHSTAATAGRASGGVSIARAASGDVSVTRRPSRGDAGRGFTSASARESQERRNEHHRNPRELARGAPRRFHFHDRRNEQVSGHPTKTQTCI